MPLNPVAHPPDCCFLKTALVTVASRILPVVFLVSLLSCSGFGGVKSPPASTGAMSSSSKVESPVKSDLVAPRQLAPAPGTVFNHFPRKTTLRWAPVAGAGKYKVEIACQEPDTGEWFPAAPHSDR